MPRGKGDPDEDPFVGFTMVQKAARPAYTPAANTAFVLSSLRIALSKETGDCLGEAVAVGVDSKNMRLLLQSAPADDPNAFKLEPDGSRYFLTGSKRLLEGMGYARPLDRNKHRHPCVTTQRNDVCAVIIKLGETLP